MRANEVRREKNFLCIIGIHDADKKKGSECKRKGCNWVRK